LGWDFRAEEGIPLRVTKDYMGLSIKIKKKQKKKTNKQTATSAFIPVFES